MKFKANGYSIKSDLLDNMEITFNVEKECAYSVKSISNDKDLSGELAIEVKKYRNPRSLNQNDMLYGIEMKLAEALHLPTQEVHKNNILNYGVKLGEAIMRSELAEKWCKDNYAKIIAEKTENDIKVAKVELYAGSSDLNTQEFSVLLDGVLQECQNVGVNVDYESKELKLLLEGK